MNTVLPSHKSDSPETTVVESGKTAHAHHVNSTRLALIQQQLTNRGTVTAVLYRDGDVPTRPKVMHIKNCRSGFGDAKRKFFAESVSNRTTAPNVDETI